MQVDAGCNRQEAMPGDAWYSLSPIQAGRARRPPPEQPAQAQAARVFYRPRRRRRRQRLPLPELFVLFVLLVPLVLPPVEVPDGSFAVGVL